VPLLGCQAASCTVFVVCGLPAWLCVLANITGHVLRAAVGASGDCCMIVF
jgi:hypothetical protein